MPLPDFFRRKKFQPWPNRRPEPSVKKSQDAANCHLPLENISEEIFSLSDSPDSPNVFSLESRRHNSCIAKSFSDVLSNPNALGYFLQFMDSRHATSLVKFCLEVISFRASSAKTRLNSTSLENDSDSVDFGNFQIASGNICDTRCDDRKNVDSINGNKIKLKCPTSPSSESIDSGILVSQAESGQTSVAVLPVQGDQDHHLTATDEALINQTKDALSIYQKYVAPESPQEIDFPLEVRNSIVTGICSESGILDDSCFDSALNYIIDVVDRKFFSEFLQSEFNAKHQVDMLTHDGGRDVNIIDILENDDLLFHFKEFLENFEGTNFSVLLEFWITATNFQEQASHSQDDSGDNHFLREDALAIYDKFISLQASSPLGFSSSMRARIEENICDGINPSCFDDALLLVVRVLHMKFVQKFINSSLFKNYIEELRSIIASGSCGRLQKDDSMSSLNTSSSMETMSISAQNTLLATSSSHRKVNPSEKSEANFLDLCSESDHLWRRKSNSITNIGRVDSLGRYTSQFEAPPDVNLNKSHHQTVTVKLSQAVKRIIMSAEVERHKEEVAWQMANMIVRDVTSRVSSSFVDN